MYAYAGVVLRVDLNASRIQKEPLNPNWARDFVGASGLAARYLYEVLNANTVPLGRENPLVWMTGMLTGSRTPSSSRSAFCARSPLTGIWGEANVGGGAGVALRRAGYDGMIIDGKAEEPVYILVDGDRVELRDARPFWGMDTFQMQQAIAQDVGDPRTCVIGIGPAGENLVRFAAIMTGDGRAAGRTGLGAVMGSKGVKAIAICSASKSVEVAGPERFRSAARRALDHSRQDFFIELLKEMGTANGVEYLHMLGDVPSKYWTGDQFEGIENLNGAVMFETIRTGSGGCRGCWVQCGPEVEISDGPFALPRVPGPEYETIGSLGSQLLVDDLAAISYLGHQCDALGMDTISAGAAIGFAHYLFEQGIIGKHQTDGLDLRWGDVDTIAELIGRIAERRGVGSSLADGTRAMEAVYGVPGMAVQINGLEPAMHDPRGISAMALVYLTSPRGACHNKSDFYMIAAGHAYPEIGVELGDPQAVEGVAPEVVRHQDWRSFIDSSGCCLFVNAPIDDMIEMTSAATGREESIATLSQAGERILTLKRMININLGLSREHEVMPDLLTRPLPDANSRGFVPPAEQMLREYYQLREWDIASGRPTPQKLIQLGLSELL